MTQAPDTPQKIRIWDAPVRVFHWLLVICFAGAYATSEGEKWRLVHVTLGYTLGGLLLFRLLWGFIGTRYARFSSFVRGPAAVLRYLKSGQPEHHLGHNPAGAVAIVLLMFVGLALTATGYATYNDIGPGWLAELHDVLGNGMLLVVMVHLLGVVTASWQHRENLVRAMFTGYKNGLPDQGIRRTWALLALVLVAVVLAFWWRQWQSAPKAESVTAAQTSVHMVRIANAAIKSIETDH